MDTSDKFQKIATNDAEDQQPPTNDDCYQPEGGEEIEKKKKKGPEPGANPKLGILYMLI